MSYLNPSAAHLWIGSSEGCLSRPPDSDGCFYLCCWIPESQARDSPSRRSLRKKKRLNMLMTLIVRYNWNHKMLYMGCGSAGRRVGGYIPITIIKSQFGLTCNQFLRLILPWLFTLIVFFLSVHIMDLLVNNCFGLHLHVYWSQDCKHDKIVDARSDRREKNVCI